MRGEKLLDRTLQAGSDVTDPVVEGVVVDGAGSGARREPEPSHAARKAQRAGSGDHRFGRDAVPEMGGSADYVPLDEDDPRTKAGRPAGSLVPARPSPDDYYFGHAPSVIALWSWRYRG